MAATRKGKNVTPKRGRVRRVNRAEEEPQPRVVIQHQPYIPTSDIQKVSS